jgi:hypothetical protein
MLRSIKQLCGDKLGASDGEFGQVKASPERSTIKCSEPPGKLRARTGEKLKPQRPGCDEK